MNLFTGILFDNPSYMAQLIAFYNQYQARVLSCLPWIAAELACHSGFEVMLKIIQKYGGRKLYIASNKADLNKKLAIDLSDEEYQRILDHTDSRGFIDLPSIWGVFLAVRRAGIIEAVQAGDPNHKIINDFGITERGLRNYKKVTGERLHRGKNDQST